MHIWFCHMLLSSSPQKLYHFALPPAICEMPDAPNVANRMYCSTFGVFTSSIGEKYLGIILIWVSHKSSWRFFHICKGHFLFFSVNCLCILHIFLSVFLLLLLITYFKSALTIRKLSPLLNKLQIFLAVCYLSFDFCRSKGCIYT